MQSLVPRLLLPKISIHYALHHLIAVVAANGYAIFSQDDFIVFYRFYFRNGNDIRFMYAHKGLAAQVLFYIF
jgi:hypothetical protein